MEDGRTLDENVGMVESEDGEVKTGEREEGRLPAESEDSLQNAEIRAEVHFRNYDPQHPVPVLEEVYVHRKSTCTLGYSGVWITSDSELQRRSKRVPP